MNIFQRIFKRRVDPSFERFSERATPTRRAGQPGTAIYSGYIVSNEEDARMQGRARYKAFSEILANVTIVAASVRYFLNLVGKVKWKIEPADESPQAEEIAQNIREMLFDEMDTPWHRIVRRAAMYRMYGFSIQEWTARRREDGLVGYADIEARPQMTIERWVTDLDSGDVLGVIQRSQRDGGELPIPRAKLVYLVDDALNDSPEGLGLLRHVQDAARRLERYEQLEGFSFETDLRGIPVGRVPFAELDKAVSLGHMTREDADARIAEMEQFLKKHIKNPQLGMLLDSIPYFGEDATKSPSNVPQWNLELMTGGGTSLSEVAATIQRISREIARIFGTEFILLGESGTGSLAMSRDKSNMFVLIVDNSLKEIGESFEKDVLGPLMLMNSWPKELTPTLKPEKLQHRNSEELTRSILDLAQSGVVFDRQDEAVQEIMDILGLTRLEEMAEQLELELRDPAMPVPEPNPDPVEKVLLSPRPGESRVDFVLRFMSNDKARSEFPDRKQRAAVANQIFRDKK